MSEHSGVSVGTVSNVINTPALVAEATRVRVQSAITDLGYSPTAAARSLKARRSFMIAYPIYDSGPASVMGAFFRYLVLRAADHGLGVTAVGYEPGQHEQRYSRLLEARAVDGFVLSEVVENDPRVGWLLDNDVPFAAFGRAEIDRPYNWVDLDIAAGMRSIARHLLDQGHRRFAFVGWDGQPTNRFRLEGLVTELRGAGLEIAPNRVIETDFSVAGGARAARTVLGQPGPPTAIVCAHDIIATGAIREALERGLKIDGRDFAITGFDDTPLALATTPALTSVAFPLEEVAAHLVGQFVERFENPDAIQTRLVTPRLVTRASSCDLS